MGRVGGIGFRKVFGWFPESFRLADAVDRSERARSNRNNCGKLTNTTILVRNSIEIGAVGSSRSSFEDPRAAFRPKGVPERSWGDPGGIRAQVTGHRGRQKSPQGAPFGDLLGALFRSFFRYVFGRVSGAVSGAFWGHFGGLLGSFSELFLSMSAFGGGTARFQILL